MIERSRIQPSPGARPGDDGGRVDPPSDAHLAVVDLHLRVSDPESQAALERLAEGEERNAYALRALRIGLLALGQAAGSIDTDGVRQEGERILAKLQVQLNGQQSFVQDRLESVLRDYFDPESGRFAERVQRLVSKDGELERVLREQVGGDDSTLLRTLADHFGPESPLMKVLSPSESQGLLLSLRKQMTDVLDRQRERILDEFSLNEEGSALSLLVGKLTQNNTDITQALETRIGDVVGEFSLDREDSALSKLVGRVDAAQQRISAEFSLDQETSALARMRREMLGVLEKHGKDDVAFREAVLAGLAEIRGRYEERQKSTRHGDDFEADFFAVVQERVQGTGDIVISTASTPGAIRHNKKGDAVLELGPDHRAAGARIVFEAKQDASYTLDKARAEIDVARRNRKAAVGVFVFSAATAPEGLLPFQRVGDDVFVRWDALDPVSDVWLEAGIEVAKALCSRDAAEREAEAAEIEEIEAAIGAIAQQAEFLDQITTSAKTIESSTAKIRERVRKSQKDLNRQVLRLRSIVDDLKASG